MTIKEGIYDIRELLNSYNIDSTLSNRHIYFVMNTYRTQVINQFLTRNPGGNRNMLTQTLYLDLENVDKSRFPEFKLINYNVLRTKKSIPNTIGKLVHKNIIIRPVERLQNEIELICKSRAAEVEYAPKGFIYAYIDDDRHLYLLNTLFLNQLTVTAILEDPRDIESIHDLDEDITTYPITQDLWGQVKDLILAKYRIKFEILEDVLNDGKDEQIPST